ncbi:MAG TPA: type IV secretion system protein [Allosphingosinicella sp.]|nr:type IV secretion system protein [Allosphingosinicella sp.]
MSVTCLAPESDAGVAVLISNYLDCQARALGENGFQALAGGALGAALLSGLLTIFVAVIGYRFILGEAPGIREGVGRTVRVGLVLALVTSWPAFQTLVYDVAVDGPRELASVMLPASGLPSQDIHARVQGAYDTMRLGLADVEAGTAQGAAAIAADPDSAGQAAGAAQRFQFQPPLPRTASLFVISTLGFEGALRIAVGFLLAVGPLALMCLLFDATLGIFSGWVRAVSGLTLATLAAMITTALDLLIVEWELARLQALRLGGSVQAIDPQALTVIVILFAIIMLVTVIAAVRMTSAFRLPVPSRERPGTNLQRDTLPQTLVSLREPAQVAIPAHSGHAVQTRVATVVESLSSSVRREQLQAAASGAGGGGAAALSRPAAAGGEIAPRSRHAGRRGLGRRTRKSALRDRKS